MDSPELNTQRDTPILSFLLGLGVILGGLPVLIFVFTKWADSPQRQVAAMVGIVTIALFALRRRKYDAVLVALLFFSQFHISLLSIDLNEPVKLQFVFSDSLFMLFMLAALERGESWRSDVVGWLFLGLIAWQAVVTFLASPHLHQSLIFLFWQLKYLVLYVLVRNLTLSDALVGHLKRAVLLILFVQGTVAVAQLIAGRPLGLNVFGEQDESRLWYVKEGLRVSGTLGASNALAGYMAMLLVFIAPFLFRWQGLVSYACFGVGFLALLFPLARAGWLSFVVGGSIVVGRLWWEGLLRPTRIFMLVVIGVVSISVGAVFYLDRIQDRFEDKAAMASAMGRVHQFDQAWPVIERYSVFGIGPGITEFYGAWSENERYVRNKLPDVKLSNQPHNSVLQYWIENGAVGMLLFAGVIVMTFVSALPKRNEVEDGSDLFLMQIGASAAAVAAMVDALFGPEINHHQIGMAFWIFLALARNRTAESIQESDREAE